jgi:ribosome maturation factor RimP
VKNRGRELKVHLLDKQIVRGKLAEVSETGIALEMEAKEGKKRVTQRLELPFHQIEKAFVMVSFK